MNPSRPMNINHIGLFFISFVVGALLTLMPLPEWALWYRPEWFALLLIYWIMAFPGRIGIGIAWCVGLFFDALTGGLIGEFALGFSLVAFLTIKWQRRLGFYPLWQQSIGIMFILVIYQLLILLIRMMTGQPPVDWKYGLPILMSMVIWPLIVYILDKRNNRSRR